MPAYMVEIEHRDTDQVFSYWHGEPGDANGGMLHFNVSLLARLHKQMAAEFRRITMDIGDDEYGLCMQHRGIEEPRVAALTPSQLREPGYAVLFPEGTFSIVDGHHRLVRRWRGGVRVMDFWITGEPVWKHCLVPYEAEAKAEIAKGLPSRVENPISLPSAVVLHPRKNK